MLSRIRSVFQPLAHRARDRWLQLTRPQKIAAGGAATALILAAAVAVVLAFEGDGSGSGSNCPKPLCVEVIGMSGGLVHPMTPVQVRLAGNLDRDAAVKALVISNEPKGSKQFEGDVLTFRPEWPGFARGVTYSVALALPGSALPAGADPVGLDFSFTTDGRLEVSSVFPEDGSREVALDAAVMLQFSRSVAPLTVIAERGPENIVTFDPVTEGAGHWLNTSIYAFQPAGQGWTPATSYTATLKAGLANQLGAQLHEDYVFSFTTLSPGVSVFLPPDNSKFVAPLPEIKVEFNQPVDSVTAQAGFSLSPQGGAPVAGSFESPDSRTFVFRPVRPLALSTTFEAIVHAGVKARDSQAVMAGDVRWSFTTVGVPRVASTTPANGDQRAPPYGVTITFTNPMNEQSVEDNIVITPKPIDDPYFSWQENRLVLYIGFQMKPSSAYRVTLSTQATDRYGQRLAAPLDLNFVTDRLLPGFRIFRASISGTFNAYREPTISATSWNLHQLDFALYRIDRSALIDREQPKGAAPYSPPASALVRGWSESIDNPPLNESVVTSTRLAADGGKLAEGVYFLRVTSSEASAYIDEMPIVVSSVNVTTKLTERHLLVWLVDMNSGDAMAGLPLDVLNASGAPLAKGSTDSQGVARIDLPAVPNEYQSYYVSASAAGRTVLASTAWGDGIQPYNFSPDLNFQFSLPDLVGHLYTDRPIYRPGETVYFKSVIRTDDDARYSLPTGANLTFSVRDAQGRLLTSQSAGLSRMGAFDTRFDLSPEASTGVYYAQIVEYGASPDQYVPTIAYVSFRVAEFRKPEFEVNVASNKEEYFSGDTINATVAADLFFGAPLANAQVSWQVTSQDYFFDHEDYPGYSFTDSPQQFYFSEGPFFQQEQFIRGQGAGQTDAAGKLAFSLPADVSSDPGSQTFTLEATATDQNGQSVGAFSAVPVHKGRFYIGVKPESYIAIAGGEAKLQLLTVDPDGEAVRNVPLTLSVYQRRWRTVRERDSEGEQRYRSEAEDTLIQTIKATTGANGEGEAGFTPASSGQYYIVAQAQDSAGNAIKSAAFVWASSAEYASWFVGNDDIIQLVADKTEYSPGDTAKILVAAPFEASRGLITQERGRLMKHDLRDFQTNSDIIEIPITSEHIPNVYIGVTLFKSPTTDNPMPQVKFGLVELRVSTDQKEITISIEADRDSYEPRDTVTYSIRTTDSKGKGVSAELSLALVDKSVLSLQDDFAGPVLEAFWRQRPLSVLTGSTFAVSIDRTNELAINRQQDGGKGGGGGPGDQTRTFFPNTAFWEPALVTDRDGRATVEVPLPDTLTTWRLTARGFTTDTKVGEASNEIIASKDLIVRPVVPRFLVVDDHAFLGAIVHNFTRTALDLQVSLSAEGVNVEGEPTQSVRVEPGDDALVRWSVTAPVGGSSVSLTFEAKGGAVSDSVQVTLPLYGFYTPETVATAGEVTDEASEGVHVPYYVRPDAGELTVSVSPSLASGVNTALAYIREHPDESAEATVSRFLPRLALQQAVDELGLTGVSAGGDDVDALVRRSVQRLYNHQRSDGGWGWWSDDASDPAVTAYVLIGLGEAKRAGVSVDPQVEEQAAVYLIGQLDKQRDVLTPEYDMRAYILYALARDERGDLGRSFALAEQRASLSNTAKAWIALAIKLSGGAQDDPRLTSLLADLRAAAIPSATGNHWEEEEYNPDIFGNSVLTTAQVLQAFTEFQPEHPLVDGTMRWLMAARKEGHWESTHDTAVALLAITDFMIVRKDAQAAFAYRVRLNGDTKLEGSAEAGKVHQEDRVAIQMNDLLKDTLNELTIARSPSSAAGRLYYTAHLRYFTPAQDVEAANHGIGVSHEYFSADGETPLTEAKLGDIVKVKVTLLAPSDLNFLTLEDYLPAGLEPIDASLKTTPPELRQTLYEEQRKAYQVSWRYSPFGHTDIRDNRVALFARFVPKGVYEYTYFAQATTPGEFKLPPATAHEQYFPEVWGRSDGGTFVVR